MRTPDFTNSQVISALTSSAGILTAAALKLGCTSMTIRNYIAREPEIKAALLEIRESNIDLAETKLLKGIRDGNMTSVIFYLKTQAKDRGYIEGRELTGPGGGAIKVEQQTIDTSKLSTQALRELREAAIAADDTADAE